ncbi:MAG: glycosyltransferase [Porticoccaceae bacterium]|nr:glycosyltransferase [Porticoccaceae bacterium]
MKILFVGQTWLGSCARSMKEALARHPEIELDELAEDAFTPKVNSKLLRGLNKLVRPLYQKEFNQQVVEKIRHGMPDFLVTYKGGFVGTDLLQSVSSMGVKTVNIYPDYSPQAYGLAHRQAVGQYDLVISTKEYHPGLWSDLYRYANRCRFVPQGYDPLLHYRDAPSTSFEYDVVMIATYREEYGRLIVELAALLNEKNIRVAIGGHGWSAKADSLPSHWFLPGAVHGDDYISLLRSGKMCIAPLTRDVVIDGARQPGDVDTTRSYELAASYCFFIHQRTDYVSGLYGSAGVPMFDDATELADHIRYFLAHDEERVDVARKAHELAVPDFSLDARVVEIISILEKELDTQVVG